MPPEPPLPYQHPQNLIGRGGPAAGGALSFVGAALALIGFLLPWVSCAGQQFNGVALAQQPGPTGEDLTWLYVVPFLALGCLGVALSVIPLAAWRRVPLLVGGLLSAFVGLLALGAAVPLVIVYNTITTGSEELGATLGLGGAVLQLEDGFWLTAVGLFGVLMGAGLGVLTAVIGLLWPKSPPRAPS